MTTKRTSSFRGKVGKDAHKSMRASRGYLNLPEGVKQYNVEENTRKVMFDILPYVVSDPKHPNRDDEAGIALKGDLWYKRPFKVHRNVGANNESCVCPKSIGKPCPICEYQKKQFDAGADKEETIELYPKDRNLYVIIPKGEKKLDEVPFVWDMSQKLFQDTLKDALDEDEENEVFPDLEEGLTLEVSFKWKTFGKSTFPEARNINFIERDKPYKESILDEVPDLDTVLKVLSYEELSNKFFELDEPEAEGSLKEVDEDVPVRERKRERVVEEEAPVERKRKTIPAKEEVEKDEPPTWEELGRLSRRNLERMVDSQKLDIDLNDFGDDEDGDHNLKAAIAQELGVEIPEDKPVRHKPTRGTASSKVEEEPEKPSRRERERPAKEAAKDERCPFGHKFGVDSEKFNDCDTCDIWGECLDKKEGK